MRLMLVVFILAPCLATAQDVNKDLREELLKMSELDQEVRSGFDSIITKYGTESDEFRELAEVMREADEKNTERLVKIVNEYGWPGRDLVGPEGNSAAWLILQHSNNETQEKYLPLFKESVDNHKSSLTEYAYLLDRVLMNRGVKQQYGTQITYNKETGKYELYQVENEENLNERRKEAGLEPIEEYLLNFDIIYKYNQDE